MTTTPFRPLPVGGVPAWLLEPFYRTSPPLLHLPPSRLQFGAELTRQGSPHPPHFSVALQLWLVATHASPRTLITSPMMATGACTTTGPSPFPRLPVGGQKGIPTPTVSAPNRWKRDNCCSAESVPRRWKPSQLPPHWCGLRGSLTKPLLGHGVSLRSLLCGPAQRGIVWTSP